MATDLERAPNGLQRARMKDAGQTSQGNRRWPSVFVARRGAHCFESRSSSTALWLCEDYPVEKYWRIRRSADLRGHFEHAVADDRKLIIVENNSVFPGHTEGR